MDTYTNKLTYIFKMWCEHNYKKSLFYNKLKEGCLSKEQAANFHYNAEVVIQNTLECIRQAQQESKSFDIELSEFFYEKSHEEAGHDKWAKKDYRKELSVDYRPDFLQLTSGALKLINKLHFISRFEPISMLGYIYFGEYYYAEVGPEVSKYYEKTFGKKSILIDTHSALDVEHIQDDIEMLDKLLVNEEIFLKIKNDVIACMNYQTQFYDEVCAIEDSVNKGKDYDKAS